MANPSRWPRAGTCRADRRSSSGMSLPRHYALIGMLLIAPTVLIFALVIAYPLVYAVYLSFFSIYTPT